MTLRSVPYQWTCLIGAVFLGSVLWSTTMLDGFGFALVVVTFLCLLTSTIASIVLAVVQRSRGSLYRILLNVAVCLLFFPAIGLGNFLRNRLFLMHLAKFQEVTDLLIANERSKGHIEGFAAGAQLRPSYSNLHVANWALIDFTKENVTVGYPSRDSSALGHRGYMYRSDDNQH